MDQSESSNTAEVSNQVEAVVLPRRTVTVELMVGAFTMVALACAAYLAVGLGGLELSGAGRYYILAEFDNISGLEYGASVEMAGVRIGEVVDIQLEDPIAVVKMKIDDTLRLRDDDIAAIRTKGIIGDRYIKISRGSSDVLIAEGERMIETESIVDFEDIIGKIIHNLGAGDD